jgi:hypothetical protein
MSDIFYSQLDERLQQELDARASAGKINRGTNALNFMLGKIANVEMTAYSSSAYTTQVGQTLGGSETRYNRFLPGGFLKERSITTINNQIDFTQSDYVATATDRFTDTSKRIPPIITSAEINIGDHSMGLLNKASVNITVPNPGRDLEYFESTWMRPGRYARIKFRHPDSALAAGELYLTDNILPTYKKLRARYPKLTQQDFNEFKRINQVVFDGLIVSFTLDYQQDGSVQVSLQLTGTSNIYTDVSLLIDTDKPPSNQIPTNKPGNSAVIVDYNAKKNTNGTSVNESTSNTDRPPNDIFDQLEQIVDTAVLGQTLSNEMRLQGKQQLKNLAEDDATIIDQWALYGKPYATGSAEYSRYVTLGYLIRFIDENVLTKLDTSTAIICDSSITTGVYYEKLVSANPARTLLMKYPRTYYGPEEIDIVDRSFALRGLDPTRIYYYDSIREQQISFLDTAEKVSYPTKVFINLETIKEITDSLLKNNNNKFNVNNFFQSISSIIKSDTGDAVNLKLITHPDGSQVLIFYDANKVLNQKTAADVKPYPLPMFANDARGTIVRDFKFSSKLPDSVKNLSYVLNQDPDKISEQDIAPYINFMYLSNSVNQTTDEFGNITNTINPDADTIASALASKYRDTYIKYQKQLQDAKENFAKNPAANHDALRSALKKYIQYPSDQIKNSNQLAAPIFPFDVSFTIDGINGFRYGDVLQFNGLPARYRINTVFSVINVTHTIGSDGVWTTGVRCIMRPKIGKQ